MAEERLLVSSEQIQRRVGEIAEEIAAKKAGKNFLMLGVLKGGVRFAVDLQAALYQLGLDVPIDFVKASSYGKGHESSRKPKIVVDTSENLSTRDILLVEDLVDGGWTLQKLLKVLKKRDPLSLTLIVFLAKVDQLHVKVQPDIVGFKLEGNPWIKGYGIDDAGFGRGGGDVVEVPQDEE